LNDVGFSAFCFLLCALTTDGLYRYVILECIMYLKMCYIVVVSNLRACRTPCGKQ